MQDEPYGVSSLSDHIQKPFIFDETRFRQIRGQWLKRLHEDILVCRNCNKKLQFGETVKRRVANGRIMSYYHYPECRLGRPNGKFFHAIEQMVKNQ
jgi:hypothetical protein